MARLAARAVVCVLLALSIHTSSVLAQRLDGSADAFDQLWQLYRATAQDSARRLAASQSSTTPRRPNFVVFMTDDQDQLLNSTHRTYMPLMHQKVASQGLQLRSFAVSSTVCCPSRVNFLTGRYSHNTNVTGNIAPRGGYSKFKRSGLDRSYLPTWLQSLGYRTYFTGKFLNGFDPAGRDKCPLGWTTFEPLIKPYVLNFWNTAFTTNCEGFHDHPDEYNTDVLTNKTLFYIQDAAKYDQPFFIQVAPIAPHEGCGPGDDVRDGDSCTQPPFPAPRHENLYNNVQLPRTSNYGVAPPANTLRWVDSVVGGRNWNPSRMLQLYLARLRSLRSVDDMIGAAVALLDELGLLDNTYVIFMSDNGFKIGNHGVAKGKMTAYEEDVRVPFFIRGPGIPQGAISDYQATMCDVPATLVDLAGATSPSPVDGTPIPLTTLVGFQPMVFPNSSTLTSRQGLGQLRVLREQVPHEMWVWGSDSRLNGRDYRALRVCTSYLAFGSNNTYRTAAQSPEATFGFRLGGSVPYSNPMAGVQTDRPMTCYKYIIWCTGAVELYDLMLDPTEVVNRYMDAPRPFLDRLNAYLVVQGFCKGADCYDPYGILHPSGNVATFADAMRPQYDSIYAALPRFEFKECTEYYYPENEIGWLQYPSNRTDVWPPRGEVPGLWD